MDSDEALFERLIGGDLSAFDRLYARLERPLLGFVRARLGGDLAEAEDVVHEAFMAVLRERDKRTAMRSFRAWLFQVANHLCLNRARSRRTAGRLVEDAEHANVGAAPSVLAEQALVLSERVAMLERAVARLPPQLAEVYRLRASGLSYEEVADTLAIPVGTVKSRMHEMIQRLKEETVG